MATTILWWIVIYQSNKILILLYMYFIHVMIHHTLGFKLQSTTNDMVLPFNGESGRHKLTGGTNGYSLDDHPILYRSSAQF